MADSAIRVSLTARQDGAIVGFLMARADLGDFGRTEPVAVIDTIGVDPGYAHRGIGHALLSQLFANLGALRIERVETIVAPRDFALLGFLYDVGFRAVAADCRSPAVAGPMTARCPTTMQCAKRCAQVDDPEAGMNIVDLGLVYGIEVAPGAVARRHDDDDRRVPDGRHDHRRRRAMRLRRSSPPARRSTCGWSGTRRGRRTR